MTAEERIEQWLEEYQSIVLPGRLEELAEDLFRDTLSELNEAREALKQCKSYCAAQDKVNERLMAEHTAAREALGEMLKILKEHWPKLEHGPACKFGHPDYGECDCRTGEIFDAMNSAEAALKGGAR